MCRRCRRCGSTRTAGPRCSSSRRCRIPSPGAGEVLIRLHASALNHLDVWIRKGLPSVPKPRILGADGAGVVEALGEGVSGFELGERVVINPGVEAAGGAIHVIGEHGDGTNARADRGSGDERLPHPRRSLVRGGGGVPARLRDRVPDARDARAPAAGGVGAAVGHRQRRVDGRARDREGARRAHDRHVVERREARACARARRRRDGEPCER